jgi:hypothetical protein
VARLNYRHAVLLTLLTVGVLLAYLFFFPDGTYFWHYMHTLFRWPSR